ncbi:hypothetical protein GCM10010969_14960 [Saccharibacillus kuerlensis]|uniref:Uncharacterized protein n=1 Tax=Saccharibacillus kuerlensis TaxID=459527 RepID=A0ABQ2KZ01_9BACL|nr:hypothetical protein GCM10010969_14960 [Saccharibacillus kuerlensis]
MQSSHSILRKKEASTRIFSWKMRESAPYAYLFENAAVHIHRGHAFFISSAVVSEIQT